MKAKKNIKYSKVTHVLALIIAMCIFSFSAIGGAVKWTGAVDSDWNNVANWTASPAGQDCVLDPGNYTGNSMSVNLTGNTTLIPKKITIQNGAKAVFDFDFSNVDGGMNSLTIKGVGSRLSITAGTIDIHSSVKVDNGATFIMSGGVLNADENFEVTQTGSVATMSGGAINVDVDVVNKKFKIKQEAVFNFSGGSIAVLEDMEIDKGGQYNQTGAGCDLNVAGLLKIKDTQGGLQSVLNLDAGNADIGSLEIDGKQSGCTPTLDVSGGTLDIIGSTVLAGDDTDTPTINISGGVVLFGGDFSHASISTDLDNLDFNLSGGAVGFNGDLNMDDLGNDDNFSQSGASTITFNNTKTWTNNGTFVASAGSVICNGVTTLSDGVGVGFFTFFNLTINAGKTLLQGAGIGAEPTDISIKGTWSNNEGAFIHRNNEVSFDGTMPQIIGGSASTTFYNMEASNSGNITLDITTIVANVLSLNGGMISIGDNNLDIGLGLGSVPYGSISGASSFKYIVTNGTGTLRQHDIGVGKRAGTIDFPVGVSTSSYTPIGLNNTGAATDRFEVRVCDKLYQNGQCSGLLVVNDAVDKTWRVDEATAGGSDIAMTIQWNLSDELAGFDRTNAVVSHYQGATWGEEGLKGPALGSGPYNYTGAGITSFSPFTIAKGGAALPIELIRFEASVTETQEVLLEWATALELNNDYYTVERSVDGEMFEYVGTVQSEGTTSRETRYSLVDYIPYKGTSYYRLSQTDFDGTTTSFALRSVHNGVVLKPHLSIYPNPSSDCSTTKISVSGFEEECEILVVLQDMFGHEYFSKVVVVSKSGQASIAVDLLNSLPSGSYIVTGSSNQDLFSQMLIVR